MARKAVAYRKPWFAAVAVLGVAGTAGGFADIALSDPNGSDPFWAVIFSLFAWFFWLIGWHSAVRMDAAGAVVDNLLVRNTIPWPALQEIQATGGLIFRLRDGATVGCLMYGDSLAGVLTGYPYLREVAARMRRTQAELSPAVAETPPDLIASLGRWHVSPWPPLLILATLELVAVLALLIH
ncbi:MAG: hypothetical protein ACRDOI_29960 [Trebonia sp.]